MLNRVTWDVTSVKRASWLQVTGQHLSGQRKSKNMDHKMGGCWVHSEGNRENRRQEERRMRAGPGGSWDSLGYSLQTVKRLWGFILILVCILRLLPNRIAVRSSHFLSTNKGLRDGIELRGGKTSLGSPTSPRHMDVYAYSELPFWPLGSSLVLKLIF